MLYIEELMKELVDKGGSDLHVTADTQPYYRVQGSLVPFREERLDEEKMYNEFEAMLGPHRIQQFRDNKELDCSYSLEGVARFRLNLFIERGRLSCVMRALSTKIPQFGDIGLPNSVQQLLNRPRGLMLVTGPTGSGKTTTLASSIDWINANHSHHILTIEDPIEFVYENKGCLVRQREVKKILNHSVMHLGLHCEDPDIILVCEMRDLETISLAITASETGLVLGTLRHHLLHRLLSNCGCLSTDAQQQIRVQLGAPIGVISQTLCKTLDKERQLQILATIMQSET